MTDRHHDTRASSSTAGFSLVEIMVVLVILAVGLLPLAFVQTRAQQNVHDSGRFSEALALAEQQMESIKSVGFGNAAPDSGFVGNFQWRSNVQNVSPGLDQLSVRVDWTERGRPQRVTVVNLISFR
jgi:prepilin-type N-terminal cleavage/methylation domain-containing protein